ncbi:hypothetical protein BC834DRAFT_673414 [Gloeopeniophorella convolvens]|nr:hypothetical protein BC834DRAFT_673414 [Gloeopeniophorella convolvens]
MAPWLREKLWLCRHMMQRQPYRGSLWNRTKSSPDRPRWRRRSHRRVQRACEVGPVTPLHSRCVYPTIPWANMTWCVVSVIPKTFLAQIARDQGVRALLTAFQESSPPTSPTSLPNGLQRPYLPSERVL